MHHRVPKNGTKASWPLTTLLFIEGAIKTEYKCVKILKIEEPEVPFFGILNTQFFDFFKFYVIVGNPRNGT